MSSSIEDLLDYNVVKKWYKCGFDEVISSFEFRTDFRKYRNSCKPCVNKQRKERESTNIEIVNERKRVYQSERLKTDANFRLVRNTRHRIHHAHKHGSNLTSN